MNTYVNSVSVKFITDQNGTAGVLIPVVVYLAGTTTKADLFNAANVAITNPTFTDDSGNYTFNIDNGFYDIIVNEGNLSEVILANQQIAETSDGDDKLNAVIPVYNASQDGSILTQINIDDSIIPNTNALSSLPAAFWFSQGNNPIVVGASTAIKFTGLSATPLKQDDGSDLTAGDIPNFKTSYCIKHDSMGQIEYRLQGTSVNSAVTSTAAGSIDNNELFPELQNYSVSRDGVTDNWIATGASSNQSSPPESFTFQSSDWAGLSANTRIEFDSPNLGSLALKNADGTDLDVSSLNDDQAYIAIVNTPFSGAPYFGVQGLSSGSIGSGILGTFACTINFGIGETNISAPVQLNDDGFSVTNLLRQNYGTATSRIKFNLDGSGGGWQSVPRTIIVSCDEKDHLATAKFSGSSIIVTLTDLTGNNIDYSDDVSCTIYYDKTSASLPTPP